MRVGLSSATAHVIRVGLGSFDRTLFTTCSPRPACPGSHFILFLLSCSYLARWLHPHLPWYTDLTLSTALFHHKIGHDGVVRAAVQGGQFA